MLHAMAGDLAVTKAYALTSVPPFIILMVPHATRTVLSDAKMDVAELGSH
jgi:hypothetical protein